MRVTERVLLYLVAIVVGCLLVFDRGGAPASSSDSAGTADLPGERPDSAADRQRDSDALIVRDASGRPRIELSAGDSGQARVVLNRASGEPGVVLLVSDDGHSEVRVVSDNSEAHLQTTDDGQLSLTLQGTRSRLQADLPASGAATIQLSGPRDASAAIGVAADGTADVRVTASKVATQAVMRVLSDGVGEFTVRSPSVDGGPTMIRTADGVSILSAELPGGKPGASLVTSPDGNSVIAVQSPDGQSEASLRMSSDGTATVFATEPQP